MISLKKPILAFLEYLTRQIQRNMSDGGINATGQTSKSITPATVDDWGGQLQADANLETVETGTPPANEGGGISVAEADFWINVKGLDLDPERVAIKINDIGSRTFVSGGRTDIYTDELNDKKVIDVFLLNTQNTLVDQVFNEYIKNL
jgi:hypothetical protein